MLKCLCPLALFALLSACADSGMTPPAPAPVTTEARPAEPSLPVPEETSERTRRLLQLEQACDQWYVAQLNQEYARMDSLEELLNDYTNRHFEPIVSDLRHGSPRHQKMMAAALGFSGRQEAVPPLLEALQHPQHEVVLHSLLSLYHLASPRKELGKDATPIVIDPNALTPYLAHPSEAIRSNAALALSRVVGPDCPKPVLLALINTAADNDAATRVHAVAALAATTDREAMPHLVKALDDSVQLVRLRAALGLGRIGDPVVAPYLVEVLRRKEEQPDVKNAAARALGLVLDKHEGLSLDPAYWDAELKSRSK